MFNFKNYPELKKCHRTYNTLLNAMYKAEARYNRSGSNEDNDFWVNTINESKNFEKEFAKTIFSVLSKEQPLIFDRRTKEYKKWCDIASDNVHEEIWTLSLVEECGRYRLPPEYYK